MSPEVLVPAQYARRSEEGLRPKDLVRTLALAAWGALALAAGVGAPAASAQGATGTIKGRISFTGKEPGNRVIRMGVDPMCAAANAGKRPINQVYLVGDNNTLGDVFVKLDGSFP